MSSKMEQKSPQPAAAAVRREYLPALTEAQASTDSRQQKAPLCGPREEMGSSTGISFPGNNTTRSGSRENTFVSERTTAVVHETYRLTNTPLLQQKTRHRLAVPQTSKNLTFPGTLCCKRRDQPPAYLQLSEPLDAGKSRIPPSTQPPFPFKTGQRCNGTRISWWFVPAKYAHTLGRRLKSYKEISTYATLEPCRHTPRTPPSRAPPSCRAPGPARRPVVSPAGCHGFARVVPFSFPVRLL